MIDEVSETEENNTTQMKLGAKLKKSAEEAKEDPYAEADRKADREREMVTRDRNRDSMFGTMLISANISKEHEARMMQMQDPHQVMQQ